MSRLRWYSHARVKRYGWKTLYVNTPRIYKWGLHVCVYLFQTFGLGTVVFRDHEDDEWVSLLQVGPCEIRFTRVRYWSRREQRDHEDEYVEKYGSQLIDETERFLQS